MVEAGVWANNGFVVAVATVAIFLSTLLLRGVAGRRRGYKLPPGPRGWPIVGSLPLMGTLPHRALFELSKKYGPLMFMHLASKKTLVVTSPQMAEQILKTHDQIMGSRPRRIITDVLFYNCNDIASAPCGPQWRRYRRVCANEIFSIARVNQFQEIREREVLNAVKFIQAESQQGKQVNLTECFGTLTTNNVTQMLMRKSYCVHKGESAADSADSGAIHEIFREILELVGAFDISNHFPILQPFDLQGLGKRTNEVHRKLDKFLDQAIEEHRQGKPGADSAVNFLDVLLAIGKTNHLEEPLAIDAIKGIVTNVLAGAIDTTSVTAIWAVAELLRHPQVMSKVQEELDSVIGPHRLLREADIPHLKYLQAVVKEALRMHPALPVLIPHEAMEACTIGQYYIPKGTTVFVNLWGIQRDSNVWERPLEFDPDRFLDSPIDMRGTHFQLFPFGSGRRMCPGMNMGLIIIQLMLAQLLHAFSWALPDNQAPEDLDMSETWGAAIAKTVSLRLLPTARLSSHVINLQQ